MSRQSKPKILRQHLAVRPLVVCCKHEARLVISALSGHARFLPDEIIFIRLLPMNQRPYVAEGEMDAFPAFPVRATADGSLSFPVYCQAEQEYAIQLFYDNNEGRQHICTLSIFAVEEDLYMRRPYKGDSHVHSIRSGGRESPETLIASYRRAGFDFMSITDHHSHEPSMEGIAMTKDMPMDMSVFPGEEVHVPEEFYHVVNFGGSLPVNQYYRDNKEEIERQFQVEIDSFDDPDCPDKREYIHRRWLARKIQEGGGLAIFIHPHWITCDFCCTSDAMIEYIIRRGDYDALELLNGMPTHDNNMQTSFYFYQAAKGNKIPIVGASDSHGTWEPSRHFDEKYSIVFAKGRSFEDIKEAIKGFYSVAVEDNKGEDFRIYGEYRLVRYGIFLAKEYFPLYKKLCSEQGEALLRYLQGEKDEIALLELLKGRTDRFYAQCFGKVV